MLEVLDNLNMWHELLIQSFVGFDTEKFVKQWSFYNQLEYRANFGHEHYFLAYVHSTLLVYLSV